MAYFNKFNNLSVENNFVSDHWIDFPHCHKKSEVCIHGKGLKRRGKIGRTKTSNPD